MLLLLHWLKVCYAATLIKHKLATLAQVAFGLIKAIILISELLALKMVTAQVTRQQNPLKQLQAKRKRPKKVKYLSRK